jgi:hypothetical protein
MSPYTYVINHLNLTLKTINRKQREAWVVQSKEHTGAVGDRGGVGHGKLASDKGQRFSVKRGRVAEEEDRFLPQFLTPES